MSAAPPPPPESLGTAPELPEPRPRTKIIYKPTLLGAIVLLRVSCVPGCEYRPAIVINDRGDTQELHVFAEPGFIFPNGAGVRVYPGMCVAEYARQGVALGEWKRR